MESNNLIDINNSPKNEEDVKESVSLVESTPDSKSTSDKEANNKPLNDVVTDKKESALEQGITSSTGEAKVEHSKQETETLSSDISIKLDGTANVDSTDNSSLNLLDNKTAVEPIVTIDRKKQNVEVVDTSVEKEVVEPNTKIADELLITNSDVKNDNLKIIGEPPNTKEKMEDEKLAINSKGDVKDISKNDNQNENKSIELPVSTMDVVDGCESSKDTIVTDVLESSNNREVTDTDTNAKDKVGGEASTENIDKEDNTANASIANVNKDEVATDASTDKTDTDEIAVDDNTKDTDKDEIVADTSAENTGKDNSVEIATEEIVGKDKTILKDNVKSNVIKVSDDKNATEDRINDKVDVDIVSATCEEDNKVSKGTSEIEKPGIVAAPASIDDGNSCTIDNSKQTNESSSFKNPEKLSFKRKAKETDLDENSEHVGKKPCVDTSNKNITSVVDTSIAVECPMEDLNLKPCKENVTSSDPVEISLPMSVDSTSTSSSIETTSIQLSKEATSVETGNVSPLPSSVESSKNVPLSDIGLPVDKSAPSLEVDDAMDCDATSLTSKVDIPAVGLSETKKSVLSDINDSNICMDETLPKISIDKPVAIEPPNNTDELGLSANDGTRVGLNSTEPTTNTLLSKPSFEAPLIDSPNIGTPSEALSLGGSPALSSVEDTETLPICPSSFDVMSVDSAEGVSMDSTPAQSVVASEKMDQDTDANSNTEDTKKSSETEIFSEFTEKIDSDKGEDDDDDDGDEDDNDDSKRTKRETRRTRNKRKASTRPRGHGGKFLKEKSHSSLIDEETRLELPQDEDSQGSSAASKRGVRRYRCEVIVPESTETFTVDKLVEYVWPLEGAIGDHYFVQEHVSQFLGIMSFKRRYPQLRRRPLEMQERDYLREQGIVSEIACDLGLTAVRSEDVLDVMYSDFPHKFEELQRLLHEKHEKQIQEHGKVDYQVATLDKSKMKEYSIKAAEDAARWNAAFNKDRKEERRYSFDLQTFSLQHPQGKLKRLTPQETKIESYPVAVLPGQFTDNYKRYSSFELDRLPLNSVLKGPLSAADILKASKDEVDAQTEDDKSKEEEPVRVLVKEKSDASIRCKVCHFSCERNKSGSPEPLIICGNCKSASHPTCCDLNLDMVEKIESYAWQCMECKTCVQCNDPDDEEKMIFCDLCDRGYHIYCVGLKRVPNGRWHCKECAICSTCGTLTPCGTENIKNAEWQHEFKKDKCNKKLKYATTLCMPCDKFWKRRQFCYICLRVYRSIPEDGMVRCANCPKYIHREVCSTVYEGERFCSNCFKTRNTSALNHSRILAAAKKKMASSF